MKMYEVGDIVNIVKKGILYYQAGKIKQINEDTELKYKIETEKKCIAYLGENDITPIKKPTLKTHCAGEKITSMDSLIGLDYLVYKHKNAEKIYGRSYFRNWKFEYIENLLKDGELYFPKFKEF